MGLPERRVPMHQRDGEGMGGPRILIGGLGKHPRDAGRAVASMATCEKARIRTFASARLVSSGGCRARGRFPSRGESRRGAGPIRTFVPAPVALGAMKPGATSFSIPMAPRVRSRMDLDVRTGARGLRAMEAAA